MGQKVNPHGLRVGIIRNWDSRWYARDERFGDLLVEDHKIRTYITAKLKNAGLAKVEIERDSTGERVRIIIRCAKPGIVLGKGGQDIDRLRKEISAMIGKSVYITIVTEKHVDQNATLVAQRIAGDLERRIAFRRATRQAIDRTMKAGAKGIKVSVSGRLNGAEIARTEHYHEGTIPLQTLRADIDYGFAEAATTYGRIGVKVWIYKGEVLTAGKNFRAREEKRNVNAKKNKV